VQQHELLLDGAWSTARLEQIAPVVVYVLGLDRVAPNLAELCPLPPAIHNDHLTTFDRVERRIPSEPWDQVRVRDVLRVLHRGSRAALLNSEVGQPLFHDIPESWDALFGRLLLLDFGSTRCDSKLLDELSELVFGVLRREMALGTRSVRSPPHDRASWRSSA